MKPMSHREFWKLVGGSLHGPPPHCVTLLLLWPVRWEMACPPLVKGQHCSGGSSSAPHSSVHYSFSSQAENNGASWLSSKWRLYASHFLKVSGELSLWSSSWGKKRAPGPASMCVCVFLLEANRSLEWFHILLLAKSEVVWTRVNFTLM